MAHPVNRIMVRYLPLKALPVLLHYSLPAVPHSLQIVLTLMSYAFFETPAQEYLAMAAYDGRVEAELSCFLQKSCWKPVLLKFPWLQVVTAVPVQCC